MTIRPDGTANVSVTSRGAHVADFIVNPADLSIYEERWRARSPSLRIEPWPTTLPEPYFTAMSGYLEPDYIYIDEADRFKNAYVMVLAEFENVRTFAVSDKSLGSSERFTRFSVKSDKDKWKADMAIPAVQWARVLEVTKSAKEVVLDESIEKFLQLVEGYYLDDELNLVWLPR